jgi:hypothetical protein
MSDVRVDRSRGALWASAFVIAALVVVQAGRFTGTTAHAEMASQRDSFTVLTCSTGRGGEQPDELLYVLDARNQALLVYEIEDARRRQVLLRDARSVEKMFTGMRQ